MVSISYAHHGMKPHGWSHFWCLVNAKNEKELRESLKRAQDAHKTTTAVLQAQACETLGQVEHYWRIWVDSLQKKLSSSYERSEEVERQRKLEFKQVESEKMLLKTRVKFLENQLRECQSKCSRLKDNGRKDNYRSNRKRDAGGSVKKFSPRVEYKKGTRFHEYGKGRTDSSKQCGRLHMPQSTKVRLRALPDTVTQTGVRLTPNCAWLSSRRWH